MTRIFLKGWSARLKVEASFSWRRERPTFKMQPSPKETCEGAFEIQLIKSNSVKEVGEETNFLRPTEKMFSPEFDQISN